ncbi:MAG: hypothetical protein IPH76_06370 [Xanthomonadales bacterium]|nr:hypothetical protein [Xanthomonadales bacterium]
MNDRELEDLMRDYEAEVAAYKRLPQSEPTALLDRAVLTKARSGRPHLPAAALDRAGRELCRRRHRRRHRLARVRGTGIRARRSHARWRTGARGDL